MSTILVVSIGEHEVKLSRFASSRGFLSFRGGRVLPRSEGEGWIGQLAEEDGVTRVILDLSPALLAWRPLELPLRDRRKLRQILPMSLKSETALEGEELVADAIPWGEGRHLAIYGRKRVATDLVTKLTTAGFEPAQVTCALFAWQMLLPVDGERGVVALADRGGMAVFRDGIPLFFRAITNEPAATVRESLAALELTEGIKVERLYVFGGLTQEQLQRSPEGVAITRLPIDRMASAFGGDSAMATNFAGAFALALARDDRQLVNFRHGDLAFQSARDPQRRQLTIAASLVIILFLLLLTDSLVRYRQVYRDASSVDGGIKSIYGQIFPGRKGSRDEVGEVRAEIRRLGGVAPTTRVLATLRTIAQAKGAEVTTLYEVTVEKGEVRIKGEGVSSEGVNAFRRRLEPSFASVELVESESRGALVNFVIRCRMREGG